MLLLMLLVSVACVPLVSSYRYHHHGSHTHALPLVEPGRVPSLPFTSFIAAHESHNTSQRHSNTVTSGPVDHQLDPTNAPPTAISPSPPVAHAALSRATLTVNETTTPTPSPSTSSAPQNTTAIITTAAPTAAANDTSKGEHKDKEKEGGEGGWMKRMAERGMHGLDPVAKSLKDLGAALGWGATQQRDASQQQAGKADNDTKTEITVPSSSDAAFRGALALSTIVLFVIFALVIVFYIIFEYLKERHERRHFMLDDESDQFDEEDRLSRDSDEDDRMVMVQRQGRDGRGGTRGSLEQLEETLRQRPTRSGRSSGSQTSVNEGEDGMNEDQYLCYEMVIPSGNELILQIPTSPLIPPQRVLPAHGQRVPSPPTAAAPGPSCRTIVDRHRKEIVKVMGQIDAFEPRNGVEETKLTVVAVETGQRLAEVQLPAAGAAAGGTSPPPPPMAVPLDYSTESGALMPVPPSPFAPRLHPQPPTSIPPLKILDGRGNLYGTAEVDGPSQRCTVYVWTAAEEPTAGGGGAEGAVEDEGVTKETVLTFVMDRQRQTIRVLSPHQRRVLAHTSRSPLQRQREPATFSPPAASARSDDIDLTHYLVRIGPGVDASLVILGCVVLEDCLALWEHFHPHPHPHTRHGHARRTDHHGAVAAAAAAAAAAKLPTTGRGPRGTS
ncbi:unnamed protein product [Vitrella brassicaformis CCMP3155]|uniref:Uncharacterized protein n=2 Tax=Vitrella brassicaformis TaxID=1169539 RepID=A0A0G4EWB2_VITBC|nr:unnamed protein product [Vitrella brassicaformis CCMP3155]|eukprot:CEM02328.1 unnamed protein product [Vitrella brassicaformis CCMP3155]